MNPLLSLISGILAAFSPCVIVLIPLFLFRFVNKKETQWKNILLLILGFLISYILFGYFLSNIFTSEIQNGIKLGAGILFIVLGVLSLMKRINPLNFPLIKNPFLLGIFFALIIAINPCTIPFISVVVALNATGLILINLIFFSLGLLIPTLLFTFFGQNFLNFTKKSGKVMVVIDNLMNFVLIGSGIYLIITIKGLYKYDIYVAAALLIIVFIILIKSFFILNSKKDILKPKNVLLLISLLLIIIVITIHCNNKLTNHNQEKLNDNFLTANNLDNSIVEEPVCSLGGVEDCTVCYNCIILFFIALILGVVGLIINKKIIK